MPSGSPPAGALPSIDFRCGDLASEFGASSTRFADEGVHVNRMRFSGRALQRYDYLLVEAAMMLFSAVFQLPVQTSRKILQSDRCHNGTVTVPFWLSTRLWRTEGGLCLLRASTRRVAVVRAKAAAEIVE